MVGTVTIGAKDGTAVEEAPPAHRAHPRPADRGGRRGLPGQGRQHHQVRRLRQHPAGPGRPAAHLQASSLAGGKRIDSVEDVARASARPSRCGSTTSTRRARSRSRWPTLPEGARRVDRGVVPCGQRRRRPESPPQPPAAERESAAAGAASFEDAFEAELVDDFGDLGPGAPDRPRTTPAAVTAAPTAARAVARVVVDRILRPAAAASAWSPRPWRMSARSPSASGSAPARATSRTTLAGASHFLEHLLFKGTATRSAAAIAEDVDEVGGDCNAFTTKEYTTFYMRLLAEHLSTGPRHLVRHHVGARRCGRTTSTPSARSSWTRS